MPSASPAAPAARIALVLAAFNGADTLPWALADLAAGMARHPDVAWKLYATDDGSQDDTTGVLGREAARLGIAADVARNPANLGLVPTLKALYARVLADTTFAATHTLKVDADRDYAPGAAMDSMRPHAGPRPVVVVGMRPRTILDQAHPYEAGRRAVVMARIVETFGITDLDPASVGIQLYHRAALETLLAHPLVVGHPFRWALDLLVPLLASELGLETRVVELAAASYDPARRPIAKVREQFDTYEQVIARVAALRAPVGAAAAAGMA